MSSTVTHLRRCAALACVLSAFLPLGNAAAADDPAPLDLSALTGPAGTQLYLTAPAGTAFDHVHVRVFRADAPEEASLSVNLKDVVLESGILTVELRDEPVGSTVAVNVQLREPGSQRTIVRNGSTVVRLRPDLVVQSVRAYRPCSSAPDGCASLQALTTQPVDIVAEAEELNGQTGASAEATLLVGDSLIATAPFTVTPGATVPVRFEDVALTKATTVQLTVRVGNVLPFETDTSNNAKDATLEVTEHELVRSTVLVPFLGGYGAQFNHHVYAPITPWPRDDEPDDDYDDFEAKTVALQPHIVRIFYNDNWEENKDGTHPYPEWVENYASFVEVVTLAQEAGAIIDISYQTIANARKTPQASMATFAGVLHDLVVGKGLTNVRWAEVGNELNATSAIPVPEYETMVRALDAQLEARGLGEQIRLMAPGLVENAGSATRNHYEWTKALATTMSDVFDAWGEHVYWNYNDTGRLEYRLRDTSNLMTVELPPEQRKPVYLMEFGIRGLDNCAGMPYSRHTYYAADPACTEIWRTRIAGFQQLWFAIGSAQLGFTGAAKWDAYWGVYDRTISPPQVYRTIGPPTEGSPLLPTYHALALLFHTTAPGWQVVRTAPWDESDWGVAKYGVEGHSSKDSPEKELATYIAPSGDMTVLGLDTNGRSLNGVSPDPPAQYSLGGLPANTNFTLVVWNGSGDGTNSNAGTVPTNAVGVARFTVPLHAAFSLTTLPVS